MTKHTARDHVWNAVLERRDRGHYNSFTPDQIVDDLAVEDVDVSAKTVRDTLNTMEEMGLLGSVGGMGRNAKTYEPPSTPGECEWCGAPFPEAGRMDIEAFDADGDKMESNTVCSACVSNRY